MKKILIIIAILVFAPASLAQTTPAPTTTTEEASGFQYPTVSDYRNVLNDYVLWNTNLANLKFYEALVFKNRKTGKTTKFSDFSKIEKRLYLLYNAELLSIKMIRLELTWSFERIQLKIEKELETTRPTTQNGKKVATSKDVDENIYAIRALRIKHAVDFEKLINNVFEEFKDEIPEEDRKFYVGRIRKFHDSQKLIDRKKDKEKKNK